MVICLKGLSFCSDRRFIFHPLPQKCAHHLLMIHKSGLSIRTLSFFQAYVLRFIHSPALGITWVLPGTVHTQYCVPVK